MVLLCRLLTAPCTFRIAERAAPVFAETVTDPFLRWVTLKPKAVRICSAAAESVFSVTDFAPGLLRTFALKALRSRVASSAFILTLAVLFGIFRIWSARVLAWLALRPMASAFLIRAARPRE